MTQVVLGLLAAGILILIGYFSSKKTAKEQAQVIDLTVKIKETQDKAAEAQKNADQKMQEYQDALKQLYPEFHTDDGDGKSSS